jgi:hypothetical protein
MFSLKITEVINKQLGCVFLFTSVCIVFLNVYFHRDYCVCGLCPSYGFLKNTTLLKLDLFPSSGEGVGSTYTVGYFRNC